MYIMYICFIYVKHRHRQQCGDGQREGGQGSEEAGRVEGKGDICNGVDSKNKDKYF